MTNTIDPIIPKSDVRKAAGGLSDSTIWRMQREGHFPQFDRISTRRVGLRLSRLREFLEGRRDWPNAA